MDINVSIKDDLKQKHQSVTASMGIEKVDSMFCVNVGLDGWGANEAEARSNLRVAISELIAALNLTLEKIEREQLH